MPTDYAKLSDEMLMAECRSDNMRAFNQLFDRYLDPLYHFALNYIKQPEVAEELVLDVMHNIWRKRHTLQIEDVRKYFFTATKNTLFNHIRKKELATVDLELVPQTMAFASDAVDSEVAYKELLKVYHDNLEQLSPQRNKIFKLSREEDMTYPEIADHMNLSVNTIKTQMLASIKFLKKNMKEHADITISLLVFYFL